MLKYASSMSPSPAFRTHCANFSMVFLLSSRDSYDSFLVGINSHSFLMTALAKVSFSFAIVYMKAENMCRAYNNPRSASETAARQRD